MNILLIHSYLKIIYIYIISYNCLLFYNVQNVKHKDNYKMILKNYLHLI